ncbi:hypothetical protein P9281_34955 [Caballeronia sp. LP003]|uniref:hypothetical protein n=1 Tax=Caballeronia sp. LP003 TaxID=3038551 RepID=UPI00285CD47C|nr:hypothetical protein [Caballeronia sp. LP003]MDR5791750.1 hypothetical protein [Caballeronia sp. LP003]
MPTVWMVSGNKGNVGKSAVAVALTQTLLTAYGEHSVSVIDGDGRTPDVHRLCLRRLPAKVLDFRRLRPDSAQSMVEDDYFNEVYRKLRISDHVVINTPDGADDQLMGWFDSTLQCTESLSQTDDDIEVGFKFLFVMNTADDGLEYLSMLASRFQMLYPVRNLFFGNTDRFATFNRDHAARFNAILDFPALGAFEYERMKRFRLLPQEFVDFRWSAKDPDVLAPRVLSRKRVQDWLSSANDTFSAAMYSDTSNLKQGISV